MASVGAKYKAKGYKPNLPLLIVPGLCSSCLHCYESTYEPWVDQRLWLNLSAIGMGKLWDFSLPMFGGKKKKDKKKEGAKSESSSNLDEEEVEMCDVDTAAKRRWLRHIVMDTNGIDDPPGIKLRPVKGLKGCAYLDPSPLTKPMSYVFGPFFETLQEIGYNDDNLRAATYDWRVPPMVTRDRDGYFDELSDMIVDMYEKAEQKKVVIMGHSLGTRCLYYFLKWANGTKGREWVDKYVDTFMPVGPLFLGAPKSVRAVVSGERMGLDAFLYPEEGIIMTRQCGSSPWMWPILTYDYEFGSFARLRDDKGNYQDRTIQQICVDGDCKRMWEIYEQYYVADKFLGDEEENKKCPEVAKMVAVYGINLETETFYFFRKSKKKNHFSALELDPHGKAPNYKCKGGIAFETKDTRQNVLKGKCRSGDGTVPYASMAYCRYWMKNKVDCEVMVEEIEKCDHRDILIDKRFTKFVVNYVCFAPPPSVLPDHYPDLHYDCKFVTKKRDLPATMNITKKGVEIIDKNKNQTKAKMSYAAIANIESSAADQTAFTLMGHDEASGIRLKSKFRADILSEIADRIRYIDRIRTEGHETDNEPRDEFGQTALHRACFEGNKAQVSKLIAEGCNVNAMDRNGWTPLHCATNQYSRDIVLALLQHPKIQVNSVSKDGTSPYHYLLRQQAKGKKEIASLEEIWSLMREKGANVNVPGKNGETPLHQSVMRMNTQAVTWLLEHNANVNASNDLGETALHYAVRNQSKDMVKLLLKYHADKHKASKEGTPMALARKVDIELFALLCGIKKEDLKKMMKNGSLDIDEYGQTKLHKACYEGRLQDVFQIMMENSEGVNIPDRNGWTPLHSAASSGNIDAVVMLINAPNVECNLYTKDDTSVMSYMVRIREDPSEPDKLWKVMNKMVDDLGAEIDHPDKFGEVPLHTSVMRENVKTAEWLLEKGADPNAQNMIGETPLHHAVRVRNKDLIKALLNNGADPSIESEKEGSPLDLAKKIDPNLVALLNVRPAVQDDDDDAMHNVGRTGSNADVVFSRARTADKSNSRRKGSNRGIAKSDVKKATTTLIKMKEEMSAVEFEGHCGAVRVFINGNAQVKRIEIDDESEDGVEDTAICKATNDALNQLKETLQKTRNLELKGVAKELQDLAHASSI